MNQIHFIPKIYTKICSANEHFMEKGDISGVQKFGEEKILMQFSGDESGDDS